MMMSLPISRVKIKMYLGTYLILEFAFPSTCTCIFKHKSLFCDCLLYYIVSVTKHS